MWKQPFWTVQLQLLPLEQQQDPASLQASLARLKQQHKATWGDDSWDGTDSKAAGSVGVGAEVGAGELGDAANLLLFARLVPYDGSEDEPSSSDDGSDSFESTVFE
jgi:hypothetical protein